MTDDKSEKKPYRGFLPGNKMQKLPRRPKKEQLLLRKALDSHNFDLLGEYLEAISRIKRPEKRIDAIKALFPYFWPKLNSYTIEAKSPEQQALENLSDREILDKVARAMAAPAKTEAVEAEFVPESADDGSKCGSGPLEGKSGDLLYKKASESNKVDSSQQFRTKTQSEPMTQCDPALRTKTQSEPMTQSPTSNGDSSSCKIDNQDIEIPPVVEAKEKTVEEMIDEARRENESDKE